MSKPRFVELSKAMIQKSRYVVISKALLNSEQTYPMSYTIAQMATITENGRDSNFFVKGGIQVDGLQALIDFRDALTIAIEKEISKNSVQA